MDFGGGGFTVSQELGEVLSGMLVKKKKKCHYLCFCGVCALLGKEKIPVILNWDLNIIVQCHLIIGNFAVIRKKFTGCSDTDDAKDGPWGVEAPWH